MMNIIRHAGLPAIAEGVIVLIVGGIVGAIVGLSNNDAGAVGTQSAGLYIWQALLLPIGLWAVIAALLDQDRAVYAQLRAALIIALLAGLFGALFARLGYVMMATNIAVLVNARLDPVAVNAALQTQLTGSAVIAVLAVTLIGAALIGVWAHQRALS